MGMAMVQWDMAAGANNYTVEGLTDGGLRVSCFTNDTYCALYNMECGQMYSVKVTATNRVCQGESSSTVTVTTGEKTRCWNFFLFFLHRREDASLHFLGS